MLYLIEILHQTTTSLSPPSAFVSCILSKFYIKPQPARRTCLQSERCILSKFYIKPQPQGRPIRSTPRCILSKFYIKPQHSLDRFFFFCVVSYRNSTSNHNPRATFSSCLYVVSYRNSTSNHNMASIGFFSSAVVSYRNSTSNHNEEGG